VTKRKRPFRVGDEVVVVNYRRWIPFPARVSVVKSVSARHVVIEGHFDPISKTALVHRTPEAERLGNLLDLEDKIRDEWEDAKHAACQPINEQYTNTLEPIQQEVRKLWREVIG
jgi:hypothetical protein